MAVGACADMMLTPGGAMLTGLVAGAMSVCGFQYVQVGKQNLAAYKIV